MPDMNDLAKLKDKFVKKGAQELSPKSILGVKGLSKRIEEESYKVDKKLLTSEYKIGQALGKELGKKMRM